MRKLTLLCLLFFLAAATQAQFLPNADFESWDSVYTNFGGYEKPTDWTTSNSFTTLNSVPGVTESAMSHSGLSAARLETLPLGFAGLPFPAYLINGEAVIDSFGSGQAMVFTGGTPVNISPNYLSGWYIFTSSSTFDSARVEIFLKRWNSSTQSRDTIGQGEKTLPKAQNYSFFEVPMNFAQPWQPGDSLIVTCYSSRPEEPKSSGKLFVDALGIDSLVGLTNHPEFHWDVFPNPSLEKVRVRVPLPGTYQLKLIDPTGKLVLSQEFRGNEWQVLLPPGTSGVFLLLLEQDGRFLAGRKLRVLR